MALASSLVSLGVVVGIFALFALGLNLKFGYTGLLDIGHVAFFLVGAYVAALLVAPPASNQQFSTYILGWNWPWLPALAVATVAAGVLGLLVALPAIRLREDYLAIAVLGISVILRRIVQSEGWLANGPDSLSGYPVPLREWFPLSGGTTDLPTAVLFGVVVAVFWAIASYLLARELRDRDGPADSALHAGYAVTTLGVGYLAARFARREDGPPDGRVAAAAGIVAGVVATLVVAVVGFGGTVDLPLLGETTSPVILAVLGPASAFTWLLAGVVAVRYFGDLGSRGWLAGGGLATAFLVPFVPIAEAGQSGVLWTVLLLVAFLAAVYYLGSNWPRLTADDLGSRGPVAAGLAVGLVASAAAAVVGLGGAVELPVLGEVPPVSLLAFVGPTVAFAGVVAAVLVSRAGDSGATGWLAGGGLAAAFIVPFAPTAASGQLQVLPTALLLVAFLAVGSLFVSGAGRTAGAPSFARLVGVAGVWLFVLRYFVLSLLEPLNAGGLDAVWPNVAENVLWLVNFQLGAGSVAASFDYSRFMLAATFAVVGATYYLLERTVNSPFGRVLTAIREDQDVATSLGKNVFSYKVQSMVLGSAIAGLAGGLYAVQLRALTHQLFLPRITFVAFLIVVIGGVADNRGPILGAVIYWAFRRGTTDIAGFFPAGSARSSVQALRLAVFGALFIIILYYRPEGIFGDEGAQTSGGG